MLLISLIVGQETNFKNIFLIDKVTKLTLMSTFLFQSHDAYALNSGEICVCVCEYLMC